MPILKLFGLQDYTILTFVHFEHWTNCRSFQLQSDTVKFLTCTLVGKTMILLVLLLTTLNKVVSCEFIVPNKQKYFSSL